MSNSALHTRCVSGQLKAALGSPIQNFPVVGMETTRHVIYYPKWWLQCLSLSTFGATVLTYEILSVVLSLVDGRSWDLGSQDNCLLLPNYLFRIRVITPISETYPIY